MEDFQGQQSATSMHMLNIAGVEPSFFPYAPKTSAPRARMATAEARHNATKTRRDSEARSLAPRSAPGVEPLVGSHLGWTVVDFATASLGALSAVLLGGHSRGMANVTPFSSQALLYALLFASCMSLLFRWSPLPDRQHGGGTPKEQLQILKTVTLAAVVVRGLLSLAGGDAVTQVMLELSVVFTFLGLTLARVYWRWRRLSWRRRGSFVRNFAIAGVTAESCQVRDYLASLSYSGYNFKGFISIDDSAPAAGIDPASVIGTIETVMPLARSMFVDEIFLIKRPKTASLKKAIAEARSCDIDLRLLPDIAETLSRRSDVHYIGDMPTIVLHRTQNREVGRFFKRLIDVLGAAFLLVFLMPLFLLLAVAVKLDSPGSVFYASDRVGRKGLVFRCFKFRTMVSNASELKEQLKHLNERDGVLFKIARDPRITRLGRILRKYSLDELPQLWNVLRGDMSLVGPRPPIGDEVQQYRIDQFCRLEVPPGITGLWQVEARSNPSFESYIELDRKYVNEWSFWLDLSILFRTAGVVVKGTGS